MDENCILRFRWSGKEYGVPAGDVQGIIGKAGAISLPSDDTQISNITLAQAAIPVLEYPTWSMRINEKSLILLHSNGVQVGLIVDEVIDVTTQSLAEQSGTIHKARFEIWRVSDIDDESGR